MSSFRKNENENAVALNIVGRNNIPTRATTDVAIFV